MVEVKKRLKVVILTKVGEAINVRADYEKYTVGDDLLSGYSRDVTAEIPNWGLEAKWETIQGIIEQA